MTSKQIMAEALQKISELDYSKAAINCCAHTAVEMAKDALSACGAQGDKIESGLAQSTGVLSNGASVIVYFTDEKAAWVFHTGVAEAINSIRAALPSKSEGK